MKNFLTILVVLTAVAGAVNVNAIDKPKSPAGMAVMKSGSVFKLFYQGTKSDNIKVTIFNASGKPVFKESLRHVENFMRPYNFSSLPDGAYTIELDGEDGKQVQKINYQTGTSQKLMSIVRVGGNSDKYMLRISNKGHETIQVKIYGQSGAMVYDGKEQLDGDFARIYDLKKIGNKFLFEVVDKNGNSETLTYKNN
jgi:hypothetical protein